MTASDVQTAEWTAVPGYYAEVTDGQPDGKARIRSVDRTLDGGRRVAGRVLSQRISNRGYVLVDVYDLDGIRWTKTLHSLMVLAFEPDGIPDGMQVRHYNDISTDNRWAEGGAANCGPGKPGNLVIGTPKDNVNDGMRNSPAAPKPPPTLCVPHGVPVTRGSSTRCHECVVQLGRAGAVLLRAGHSREDAANALAYSSPDGLYKLAVKYGGYVELPPAGPPRRSRRVMATVRHWLRFGRGDVQ